MTGNKLAGNRGLTPATELRLPELLGAWVKLGLLRFRRAVLEDDTVLVPLLQNQILSLSSCEADFDWERYTHLVAAQLQRVNGIHPMARLQSVLELRTTDLYLLALLGELESNHAVNLVVRELQQPDNSPRLSMHLAASLLAYLFPDSVGSDQFTRRFLTRPLVIHQLVECTVDVPLPLAKLKISPYLYAMLCDEDVLWPGCEWLQSDRAGILCAASGVDASRSAALIQAGENQGHHNTSTCVVVRGVPGSGRRAFALQLAQHLGLRPILVNTEAWVQQPALPLICRCAGWLPVLQPELGPGEKFRLRPQTAGVGPVMAIILGIDGAVDGSHFLEVDMQVPQVSDRRQQWQALLGNESLACELAKSALLSVNNVLQIAEGARRLALQDNKSSVGKRHIKLARRYLGAEKLRLLAQPVHRDVGTDAMAFPNGVREGLELLLSRARQREAVWLNLGVTLRATSSPGVRALFVGESGTGKTLAASYVASELAAPLYRVDLAAVMNKYIGESEKNLSQLLDFAAATDVVLLFDEADSLFGARSEGKETGERFANMLTNFLLTRIENHPGIVILTTNGSERIDGAFTRRIDVQIEFPLPAFQERLQLWRCHLGSECLDDKICASIASQCDLNGGQVRNAVLAAASYADGMPMTIHHLLRGIQLEYGKLGRSVPRSIERAASNESSPGGNIN